MATFYYPIYDTTTNGSGELTNFNNITAGNASVTDQTNLKTVSVRDTGDYYEIDFTVLVGLTRLSVVDITEGGQIISSFSEAYIPDSLKLSVYGNETTISFENVSASSENIDSAKSITKISTGKLVQDVTQVGSTQAGNYNDGTKITNVIKSDIFNDYEDGISNATVTVCCDDYYNASGTKVIDWTNGGIFKVGQIVFFTDDKYNNGYQRYWRITGRKFYLDGAPYCDLELQEMKKYYLAGLYDNNDDLTYLWDDLVENEYITLSTSGRLGILSSDATNINGKLIIDDLVTGLGYQSFKQCNGLKEVIFTNYSKLQDIQMFSFQECSNLKKVTLPSNNTFTRIYNDAFYHCTSLEEITIPKSVERMDYAVFAGCSSLRKVTFEENSQLTSMYPSCFSGCTSLNNVVLPNSLTSISEGTFYGCTSLTNITIPNSITYIDYEAFMECTGLTEIILPSNLTEIAGEAFYDCTNILKYDFTSATAVPTLSNISCFNGINENCKIVVPDSLYSTWKSSANWSYYANYIYKASDVE